MLVIAFLGAFLSFVFVSAAETCQSTQRTFGLLEGTVQRVPVAYQLELQPGTAVESVLETVEAALVDQLLPYVFRECTEDELITDVITGIHSSSLHTVDGLACDSTQTTRTDTVCFVLRGHLDVYLGDPHAAGIVRQAIAMDLQAVLDRHAVDHVANDVVVDVSFVDVQRLPPAKYDMTVDETASSSTSYTYLSLVNLVLVSLALVCHRCQGTHENRHQYLPLVSR